MYCGQTVGRKELAIPFYKAITTTYKLLKVTMSLSAVFWPQFGMQCFCLTCTKLPYLILALILASSLATSPDRIWDCSHSGKSLSCRNRKSDTGFHLYRRYGRSIAATAGIFVLQDACCIHVRLSNALKNTWFVLLY